MHQDWFERWFDSPFYHILYQNRDYSEAEKFIQNLLTLLKPPPMSCVLDLACGKGRHSVVLAKSGLRVSGADLSPASIKAAKELETDNLNFFVHDMREKLPLPLYHYVFNLFTSFGYFADQRDNSKAVRSVYEGLAAGGMFVVDFLNATKTINQLIPEEVRLIDGIFFRLNRSLEKDQIVKKISFEHEGKAYAFEEKVQALSLEDFQVLFAEYFKIERVFGSYDLGAFDENKSDRLILIARKDA